MSIESWLRETRDGSAYLQQLGDELSQEEPPGQARDPLFHVTDWCFHLQPDVAVGDDPSDPLVQGLRTVPKDRFCSANGLQRTDAPPLPSP